MKNIKYKIGYTAGVYDLFHIGHLNLLRRAKEKCNSLIVGVSTDELVLNYKKRRPIINFSERVSIVEAIRFVDKVVPQTDRDKFTAFQKLNFDVLFVGDDWKGTPFWMDLEKRLNKVDVDVIYLSYTKSVSSSELVKKINLNIRSK